MSSFYHYNGVKYRLCENCGHPMCEDGDALEFETVVCACGGAHIEPAPDEEENEQWPDPSGRAPDINPYGGD